MDLSVFLPSSDPTKIQASLYALAKVLEKQSWVRPGSIQVIESATVPVVKLLSRSNISVDITFPHVRPHPPLGSLNEGSSFIMSNFSI